MLLLRDSAFSLVLLVSKEEIGDVVAGDVAYANRPHTGVPEIGQFAYATSPCTHGSALPVVAVHASRTLPVARYLGCTRLVVYQPTDFWYSSMRADDKQPTVRTVLTKHGTQSDQLTVNKVSRLAGTTFPSFNVNTPFSSFASLVAASISSANW
jgi:hypothetical protein